MQIITATITGDSLKLLIKRSTDLRAAAVSTSIRGTKTSGCTEDGNMILALLGLLAFKGQTYTSWAIHSGAIFIYRIFGAKIKMTEMHIMNPV